jgi:hypothetical protein
MSTLKPLSEQQLRSAFERAAAAVDGSSVSESKSPGCGDARCPWCHQSTSQPPRRTEHLPHPVAEEVMLPWMLPETSAERAYARYSRLGPSADGTYDHRANMLADEAQSLRDDNSRLLAENAKLRRELERLKH